MNETAMNNYIRTETPSEVKEKVRTALGFDRKSGLDVLRQQDYATRDEYIEACARYDLEHSDPALEKRVIEVSRELSEREEKKIRRQQSEDYKKCLNDVFIQPYEKEKLEKQARDIANADLGSGKTNMRSFGARVKEVYTELEDKLRAEKASAMQMNAMLRGK